MVTKIDDDRTIAITTFLQRVIQPFQALSYSFGLLQPAAAFPSTACCGRSACGNDRQTLKLAAGCQRQSGSGLPQSKVDGKSRDDFMDRFTMINIKSFASRDFHLP
jgi:hypothetical protein